jgi:hypothetical protein
MATWSQIVAKGNEMKIPTASLTRPDRTKMETVMIYEIPDMTARMRIHRAEAILQLPLHNNTVLFEFPTAAFPVKEDAITHLGKEIGTMLGARTINAPTGRNNGKFIIEARFAQEQDTDKAISTGVTIDDIQYKAILSRSQEGTLPNMVRVHVGGIPFEATDDLINHIQSSMGTYGKVCQILISQQRHTFMGQISVLLDIDESQGDYEPLTRMLFLESWGIYVPASFKGAPPACFQCRQSGHLRRDCPELAAIICYNCQGRGHIARHCAQAKGPTRRIYNDVEETIVPAGNTEKIVKKQKNEENKKENNEEKNGKTTTVKKEEKSEQKNEKKIDETEKEPVKEHKDLAPADGGRTPKTTISSNSNSSNSSLTSNASMTPTEEVNTNNMDECNREDYEHAKQEAAKPLFDQGNINASQHAPYSVRTTMPIDTEAEMREPPTKIPTMINDKKAMMAHSTTAKTTKRISPSKTKESSTHIPDLRAFAIASNPSGKSTTVRPNTTTHHSQ